MAENDAPKELLVAGDNVNPACRDFLQTGVTAALPFLPHTRSLPEPVRSLVVQSGLQSIAEKAIGWGICPRGTFLECDLKPEHFEQGNRNLPNCSVSVPDYRRSPLR